MSTPHQRIEQQVFQCRHFHYDTHIYAVRRERRGQQPQRRHVWGCLRESATQVQLSMMGSMRPGRDAGRGEEELHAEK